MTLIKLSHILSHFYVKKVYSHRCSQSCSFKAGVKRCRCKTMVLKTLQLDLKWMEHKKPTVYKRRRYLQN